MPKRKRGKKGDTRSEVVLDRVRRAWRGDWGALFAEASMVSRSGGGTARGDQQARLQADVKAIEACIGDGLPSKAVSWAKRAMEMVADSNTVCESLQSAISPESCLRSRKDECRAGANHCAIAKEM